jgi:uncharacterized protein (DUF2062 family)
MPKKYVRKFLPSHASVRGSRYVAVFGPALNRPNLWHLNRRSVAGGVAVGAFCGMIPVPIQMLCAAIIAMALRVNLAVAMAATWYINPFTIVPLYYLAYKIGALVTGVAPRENVPPPVKLSLENVSDWLPILMSWIDTMGKPVLVGLCTLGAALSVASYFAVRGAGRLYIVMAWRRRERTRHGGPDVVSEK